MKILPSKIIGAAIVFASALSLAAAAMAQPSPGDSGQAPAAAEGQQAPSPQEQPSTSAGGSGATLKIGYLSCHIASGWGDILTSSRKMKCVYSPLHGSSERYTGTVTKIGVEVGYLSSAVMIWGVLAPSSYMPGGALAGSYGGVNVGAAAVYGGSVSAIFGGFKHSIQLEPITISGEKGLNLAAGVEKLTLHYEGKAPRQASAHD